MRIYASGQLTQLSYAICMLFVLAFQLRTEVLASRMSSRTNLHAREEQDSLPKNLTYVDYRRLKPLPITIPHNSTGRLYSKYQPYIHINEGCVPYPAVDSTGRIR